MSELRSKGEMTRLCSTNREGREIETRQMLSVIRSVSDLIERSVLIKGLPR